MIPKKIHYLFGLDQYFSNKEFGFINYLCIKSAKIFNPNYQINLHYVFEPQNNIWWNKTKEFVNSIQLNDEFSVISNQKIKYTEHIADLRRLLILKEIGGIYLDVDVVCFKSFDDLLFHKVVMGEEIFNNRINGLCNAVILSEPNSEFIKKWIELFYEEFDNKDWNKMAVRMPHQVATKYSTLIHIEPHTSFFKYDWYNIVDLYCYNEHFNAELNYSYCLHLWQSKWYHFALKYITPENLSLNDSDLYKIFKNILRCSI